MTAMLELPADITELVEQPETCPSWCDQGSGHYDDHYHMGDLGKATVDDTRKAPDGGLWKRELLITVGGLPGDEPTILVSSDGFDGFQGSPDEIESFGYALLDAAEAARDEPAAPVEPIIEPEWVARLSEGQAAADEVAEILTGLVGHEVETCGGENPDDVAVLLYPADVRALLALIRPA